ncbi:response regulator [Roseateles sp.]|jgi:DNA-binding response OmpR family regulator|uniref:response regulator n=1 Tax=Roseateles sp. TaxID=1971397 RepID=UPI003BA90A94
MSARLLLIEDDASIARYVQLALEELPDFEPAAPAVELSVVSRLSLARDALAAGGWQLVISDFMLPDGSAEALLAEGWPQRTGAPPWVIFSAGLHEGRARELAAHGVARTLRKPVPLAQLLTTIAELLDPARAADAAVPAAPVVVQDPVQQHFGGDRALFDSFRAGCIERFAADIDAGNAAWAAADVAALRHVAHGLKAVLVLIGHGDLAEQARALEQGAADWTPGQPLPGGWNALAQGLQALRAPGAD